MAIVSDRKMIYERKIAELQTQLTEVSGSLKKSIAHMTKNNVSFYFLPVRLHMWNVSFQTRDHNHVTLQQTNSVVYFRDTPAMNHQDPAMFWNRRPVYQQLLVLQMWRHEGEHSPEGGYLDVWCF